MTEPIMSDEEIIQLIKSEFQNPQYGDIKALLSVHEPELKDDRLFVERIDREKNGLIIAYIPVKKEFFYFAVYIDTKEKEVFKIRTEAGNHVYLRVTSETLSLEDLQGYTKLYPTKAWNKGDYRAGGKSKYHFSSIIVEPNPEPDKFEDKLKKLLKYLMRDKDGIHALVKNATAYISVTKEYRTETFMGRILIDTECIAMLNELHLEIDFDITSWGNPFVEQSKLG